MSSAERLCVNCGERPCQPAQRRCTPCHSYRGAHGRERPPMPHQPRSAAILPCRHCGRPTGPSQRGRGLCRACNNYEARHDGRPRPLLPHPTGPGPCVICDRPVARRMRGRCGACYQYWRQHGRDWPQAADPPRRIVAAELARHRARQRVPRPAPGWFWTTRPVWGWHPPVGYCQPTDYGQVVGCAVCVYQATCRALGAPAAAP